MDISLPGSMPADLQMTTRSAVESLAAIPGVLAIVLGGSYARGLQHADSDVDLGLYYSDAQPFAIQAIREVAETLSAGAAPQVTGFYGWGPWVNGGAWIHTPAGKVDFIYRSLDQVQRVIRAAQAGQTEHDFDQQPAYGFYSVIYLAETQVCLPLHDPKGAVRDLKSQVASYPPRLKEKILASSLWLAEFTLVHAAGYAAQGNVYPAAGAFTCAAAYLTQALFALNEIYFTSDKTAVRELAAMPIVPAGYIAELEAVLACPGYEPAALQVSLGRMRALWSSVVELTHGAYRPAFVL